LRSRGQEVERSRGLDTSLSPQPSALRPPLSALRPQPSALCPLPSALSSQPSALGLLKISGQELPFQDNE